MIRFICSLETRANKAEEERDSLRLAISLVYNPNKSEEFSQPKPAGRRSKNWNQTKSLKHQQKVHQKEDELNSSVIGQNHFTVLEIQDDEAEELNGEDNRRNNPGNI